MSGPWDDYAPAPKAPGPWDDYAPAPAGTLDRAVSTVNAPINWLGTQFTKAGTGILGAPRGVADMLEAGATWAGDKLGMPETGRKIGVGAHFIIPGGTAPRADDYNRAIFAGSPPQRPGSMIPNINLGVPEVNAGDNPAFTVNTPAGKVNLGSAADVGAQAVPMALAGGGGILPNFFGGVTSDLAGQATKGTPYELPARILGSYPGSWVGAKATTPFIADLSPQQAQTVKLAKENGIRMSAGQETGNPFLKWLEDRLAGTFGSSGEMEKLAKGQSKDVTRAGLKTMGVAGDDVSPQAMKDVKTQAQAEYKAATEMPGTVNLTPSFFGDIKNTLGNYTENAGANAVPSVEKNVKSLTVLEPGKPPLPPLTATAVRQETPTLARLTQAIEDASLPQGVAGTGRNQSETLASWLSKGSMKPMPKAPPELSNSTYQSFRKTISDTVSDLYDAGKTDAARALQKVRTSLDDAAGASLPAERMEAWKTAREHYYNFKIIEKAAGKGTAGSRSDGTLSPTALTQALRQRQGDAFSSTTGGLNDVARVGEYLAANGPRPGAPLAPVNLGSNTVSAATLGVPANLLGRAVTGSYGAGFLRNYLANQAQPNRLQAVGMSSVGLAPGMLTDQQRLRLMDQRGQ